MARSRKNKTLEERVEKYLSEWAEFLGLSQTWEIRASVVHNIDIGPNEDAVIAAAEIHVLLPYRKADIAIGKCLAEYSDYDLERSMLHELLHIPFEPIRVSAKGQDTLHNLIGDLTETTIDFLTRALLRLKYGDRLPTVRIDKS